MESAFTKLGRQNLKKLTFTLQFKWENAYTVENIKWIVVFCTTNRAITFKNEVHGRWLKCEGYIQTIASKKNKNLKRAFGLGGTELYNSVSSLIIQNTWNPHKKKKKKKSCLESFLSVVFITQNSKNWKNWVWVMKTGTIFLSFQNFKLEFQWHCGTHVQRLVELDPLPLILPLALTFLFLISLLHISEFQRFSFHLFFSSHLIS